MSEPHHHSVVRAQYDAARQDAGLIDRNDRGRIVVSGKDRASYLHGLFTNDIAVLTAGHGCYSAYLTPQGRMITDASVYELGDVILLSLGRDVKDTLLAMLDRFIFSEDVQLDDVTDAFGGMAIVGPRSAALVESVLTGVSPGALASLPEHGNLRAQVAGNAVIVLRVTDTGEPGYELLLDVAQAPTLTTMLRERGAVEVDEPTREAIRIESGVPKFHRDMDEETIPLEAGIEARAISLTKGCYVGQEVIIRVLHRGHGRVARKLVGLTLEGTIGPLPGAAVQAEGHDVGHLTSVTWSPALTRLIALGYLHRDFVAPGTNVTVNGEPALVTALPFVGLP